MQINTCFSSNVILVTAFLGSKTDAELKLFSSSFVCKSFPKDCPVLRKKIVIVNWGLLSRQHFKNIAYSICITPLSYWNWIIICRCCSIYGHYPQNKLSWLLLFAWRIMFMHFFNLSRALMSPVSHRGRPYSNINVGVHFLTFYSTLRTDDLCNLSSADSEL